MIRTQISLTEEQLHRLRRIAAERRVSMAAVIRDAVDRVAEEDETGRRAHWVRALSALGRYHGSGENVSEEHDRYLDEAYRDR